MKILVSFCTLCDAPVEVPEHYISKKVRCTSCFKEFIAEIFPEAPQATIPLALVPEESLLPASVLETPVTVLPAKPRHSLTAMTAVSLVVAIASAAFAAYEMQQRLLLEQKFSATERAIRLAVIADEEPDPALQRLDTLTDDLTQMDAAMVSLASESKRNGSTILRSEYATQYAQKIITRQQDEMHKLSLRLVTLEREVADKDKQAAAVLDLAVKQRKEADEIATPIRARIKELEQQKEKLFEQYKRGSTPQFPAGVTSTRRAVEMMNEFESRRAPLLRQLEADIEAVRRSIEEEEDRLDELFLKTK